MKKKGRKARVYKPEIKFKEVMGIFKRFFAIIVSTGIIPVLFVIIFIFYYQFSLKEKLLEERGKFCDFLAVSSYESIDNFSKKLDYVHYLKKVYRDDNEFLMSIINKYNELELAVLLDENGIETHRYSRSLLSRLFPKINVSNKRYFGELKKNRSGIIEDFKIVKNIPLATIVYPVDNNFLYLVVNLKSFFSYIYSFRSSRTGYVFYVSGNGVVLSSLKVELGYFDLEKIKDKTSGYIDIEMNGKSYLAVFRKIENFDIYVVMIEEKKELFRDINLLFYTLLFVLFFTLTVSYFFALSMSNRLAFPISLLIDRSKEIAEGRFDRSVDIKSDFNEINELVSAFNTMSKKINDYNALQIDRIMDEREKLKMIAENIDVIIVLSDLSCRAVYLNSKAKKLLGEEEERVREFIHNRITQIYKTRSRIVMEGDKYFEISIELVRFQRSNPLILFIGKDVSLEVNIQKMKEEIFRSIAHDIRTPLLNMDGYIKLLSYINDEKVKKYAAGLKEESDIIFKMVENILDLSRIEDRKMELNLERINLNDLIKSIAERFKIRASVKNISFDFKLPSDELYVMIDRILFTRAIENILTNAFKYTDEGGSVFIELKKEDRIKIIISDTGKGIEEEKLKEIFERFKSFSKDGFGLGLSIARTIINLHNGEIYVKSVYGKGSVFTVVI